MALQPGRLTVVGSERGRREVVVAAGLVQPGESRPTGRRRFNCKWYAKQNTRMRELKIERVGLNRKLATCHKFWVRSLPVIGLYSPTDILIPYSFFINDIKMWGGNETKNENQNKK